MLWLDGQDFVSDTEEPSLTWLQEYIHPDDQPQVLETIQEAIRTKSIFEMEHPMQWVDSTFGLTFSRAMPLLDAGGEIVEWFGTLSDETARKQAEEALRESEGRFRTLAETQAPAQAHCGSWSWKITRQRAWCPRNCWRAGGMTLPRSGPRRRRSAPIILVIMTASSVT